MTQRKNYWNRNYIILMLIMPIYMVQFQITIMNFQRPIATTYEVLLYQQDSTEVLDVDLLIGDNKVIEVEELSAPEETHEYTDEEKLVMCLSYAEAANQGVYGQKLVMETVRNRTESEKFPDTFSEVCLARKQFDVAKDDWIYLYGEKLEFDVITEEMQQAFDEVIAGSCDTEELLKQVAYEKGYTDEKYWKGGALYFSNLDEILKNSPEQYKDSNYDKIKVSVTIGNHTFWRYWG
jgi:hypothetical protein